MLAFLTGLAGVTLYSQENERQAVFINGQSDDIFYHTIEWGQTVYAIATMYEVGVEDIYRLNPESRNGIKAGAVLQIPQKGLATTVAQSGEPLYTFHTIQPKETLYSMSVKYNVPAGDIIAANPGLSVSTFTIGKTIRIPPTEIDNLPRRETRTVTKEIEYTIDKRETMYRITRKFNVSSDELIRRNPPLRNGMKAGMVIKIPVQAEETVTDHVPFVREKEVNALLSEPKGINRVNRIRVALLLPFMSEESVSSPTTLRYIEYYEGLLLAIDSLRNMGISVELTVRDTGSGIKKLNHILKEEALLNAHLIIGAVQNDQIKPVADFAKAHNIKYVIPFTSRNDDVLSNSCIFQVNTPHSYLYAKAAQTGCDLFADDHIIFIDTKDNDDKGEFIRTFKQELAGRDIAYKELLYDDAGFPADIESLMSRDKRNVIVPVSSTSEFFNKIRVPLRILVDTHQEYRISLFGYPDWQTYTNEFLDDFFTLNTFIYTHFYADNMSPDVLDFYSKYTIWYSKNLLNTFPKYGILGFDTGMFFLEAINKYGSNFEDHMDKIYYKSIQTGFDFQRVNNWGGFVNTNLFIIQYNRDHYTITRHQIK
ncbi:MAG: LysM peptidoglycan-binding domain-containing protein [Tannerellaceae bacterium]|nr:LysM peptidoglycan-binding domain-containing protein [Tannerellaceae bacterium]